jgi:hypothetical protein
MLKGHVTSCFRDEVGRCRHFSEEHCAIFFIVKVLRNKIVNLKNYGACTVATMPQYFFPICFNFIRQLLLAPNEHAFQGFQILRIFLELFCITDRFPVVFITGETSYTFYT